MVNKIEWLSLIWEHWNIRVVLLLNLFLLVILVLLAPIRKWTANNIIILLLWSAYQLANKLPAFAIGLLLRSKDMSPLMAMWASILLVHLGGSDTITAFSLEDNQLWSRHLLDFGFYSASTVYVFILTLSRSMLIAPTSLLFLAGSIKYLERTRSFYLASKETYRDSMIRQPEPGLDYASLMNEYGPSIPDPEGTTQNPSIGRDVNVVGDARSGWEVPVEMGMLVKAHHCFDHMKGLIVDLPVKKDKYQEVRILWRDTERDSKSALIMIEMVLNRFYEVLYTKAIVLQTRLGMLFRFISLVLLVAVCLLFQFDVENGDFDSIDVRITKMLLFGAFSLDILALVKAIFSDWTLSGALRISLDRNYPTSLKSHLCDCVVWLNIKFFVPNRSRRDVDQRRLHVLVSSGRGFRDVSGFNFIRYCLGRSPHIPPGKCCSCIQLVRDTISSTRVDKLFQWVGLPDLLTELQYKSVESLTHQCWEFILSELRIKSEDDRAGNLADSRGEWVLETHFGDEEELPALMSYIVNFTFSESLLLWHIATGLLYYEKELHPEEDDDYEDRYLSKILSDYMLYLLNMKPTMMEAVSSTDQILRFQDTCADAKRFFKNTGRKPNQLKTMCKMALDQKMDIPAHEVRRGGEGKSVFFEADTLATKMRFKPRKWKILSKVWAEMLSYAASHCSSTSHAQQISKGGELITSVWLAMALYGVRKTQL